MTKLKVGMISLGCNKNRVDSETALGLLREHGYELTNDPAQADVLMVNTCGFIASAKEESIDAILDMARYKQIGKCRALVVTGCLAQRYEKDLMQEIPEIDLLMGVNQYQQLPDALEKALGGVRKSYCMDDHTYYAHDRVLTTPSYTAYTRIGEGCSNCCTFCAIPKIRGPYRSRPEADILREIESLAKQGVKEHILVAQDTSRYGMDFGGGSKLAELMQKAAKIDGVDWLRVLYCYPEETSEQLLDIIANTPNICSYVDLPIQHVNDAVLKRMHRRGTSADIRRAVKGAHERGIRVIMDLVVNHTSDEHPWFQASRRGEEPYKDYYIWRKPKKDGTLPNNWDSMFEGKAWQYDEVRKAYYLHIFAIKQPDLNMDNPRVRAEVKKILRFWLDMGVDGFREDVITYISKPKGLPDAPFYMPMARGIFQYNNGPHLHEYLNEFRTVLDDYDCVTIGEAPLITTKRALDFIGGKHPELDMMIPFQCMEGDCFLQDYSHHPFCLVKLKTIWQHWQKALHGKGWNLLYIENHDHPRVISRYGSEKYNTESGKALAASYLFQEGTPIVYQGQEIGMTNIYPETIDGYEDVQTINQYHHFATHKSEKKRMQRIYWGSRDSARTPVQWSDAPNAGFTTGTPWFAVNENYPKINVAAQEDDPDSLLNFYREALRLRHELPVVRYGTFRQYYPLSNKLFVYERRAKRERLLVICSYSVNPVKFKAPRGYDLRKGRLLLKSHTDYIENNGFVTQPYETRVYLFRDEEKKE